MLYRYVVAFLKQRRAERTPTFLETSKAITGIDYLSQHRTNRFSFCFNKHLTPLPCFQSLSSDVWGNVWYPKFLPVCHGSWENLKQKNIFMPKEQYSNIMEIKRIVSCLRHFCWFSSLCPCLEFLSGTRLRPMFRKLGLYLKPNTTFRESIQSAQTGKSPNPANAERKLITLGFAAEGFGSILIMRIFSPTIPVQLGIFIL